MSVHVRALALTIATLLTLSACAPGASPAPGGTPGQTPGESPAGTPGQTPAQSPAADIPAMVCVGVDTTYQHWLEGTLEITDHDPIEQPADMDDPDDLLNIVRDRGVLLVSTDPEYPPQSALTPDDEFEGFDIDVANEIGERLGVDIQFETPSWDAITAGSWAGRWDISIGSMTITDERKVRLSFTQPYYYTPAQLAASTRSGVDSLDDLPFELPDGADFTTLPTDVNCAEAINAGRTDFELWMSAAQTIQEAIDAGMPVQFAGDPQFAEPLAIAIDKSGPPHDALLYQLDQIIGEMHADGTLTELSMEWYGVDITQGAD
jgi:polar amino acid transport system substrate-binding protein